MVMRCCWWLAIEIAAAPEITEEDCKSGRISIGLGLRVAMSVTLKRGVGKGD